jgi:hypothetical protein
MNPGEGDEFSRVSASGGSPLNIASLRFCWRCGCDNGQIEICPSRILLSKSQADKKMGSICWLPPNPNNKYNNDGMYVIIISKMSTKNIRTRRSLKIQLLCLYGELFENFTRTMILR